QCITLPATGWTAIKSGGFNYRDPKLANGPVKVAQIKKTPSGTFQIKATLHGSQITVAPGNPTATYALNLTIGGGDSYCTGNGPATPKPNDAKTFGVHNDTAPAACTALTCVGGTTTTTAAATTTTTVGATTTTTAAATTTTTVGATTSTTVGATTTTTG